MKEYYHLEVGSYRITLPIDAVLEIYHTPFNENIQDQVIHTYWKVTLNRFFLSIHLSAVSGLKDLKPFIDNTTKGDVTLSSIHINNIQGVKFGSYNGSRTWIDWWLKKFDTSLCINLQSTSFPQATPTKSDVQQHNRVINSIKYIGKGAQAEEKP